MMQFFTHLINLLFTTTFSFKTPSFMTQSSDYNLL